LAEDITAALERKLILGDFSENGKTVAGTSHLYLRRILTTAAMLFLPLGLLSFVVYEIMKPATVGPAVYVSSNQTLAQEQKDSLAVVMPAFDKELPFDGILTLETSQQMTVSNFIEKIIFDQGLNSFPNRTANTATYQITASPAQIKELVDSLGDAWPHCSVTLSIMDGFAGRTIKIPYVQAEQVKSLAAADNQVVLNQLAEQYVVANENKKTLFAKGEDSEVQDIGLDDSPRLSVPILTGVSEPVLKPVAPDQPMVQLRIHVKQVAE
jgi:hypothetical protein